MLPTRRGSNPQPPDNQSDAHFTEPPRLVIYWCIRAEKNLTSIIVGLSCVALIIFGVAMISNYKANLAYLNTVDLDQPTNTCIDEGFLCFPVDSTMSRRLSFH